MGLLSDYYKQLILGIHRGNACGVFSNAKPFLMLAIMSGIEEGSIIANCIKLNDTLKSLYLMQWSKYALTSNVTPITKPFFHLNSESFYNLRFAKENVKVIMSYTPSAKFLRENVEYAYLDDQLWELLQDKETREEYKKAIVDFYIKRQTT